MSEQTPTSTDDLNGVEPSMEDILASIRKIISEDEPVALESPEDVQTAGFVDTAAPVAAAGILASFGLGSSQEGNDLPSDIGSTLGGAEGDSVDLNIDDVLAGLNDLDGESQFASEDLQIPEIPVDAVENFSVEDISVKSFLPDLEAPDVADVATAAAEPIETTLDETAFDNDEDVFAFLDSDDTLASVSEELLIDVPDLVSAPDAEAQISDLLEVVSDDVSDSLPEALIDSGGLVDTDANDMDAMLDDILLAPEEVPESLVGDFIAPEALDDIPEEPADLDAAEQSDLDLVKSLMAELADDPSSYAPDANIDAVLDDAVLDDAVLDDTVLDDGLLDDIDLVADDVSVEDISIEDMILPESLPEVFETAELAPDVSLEADGEDVLGDILDMSLEDELQDQPDDFDLGDLASLDDVAAAEQENILENILEDGAPIGAGEADYLANTPLQDTLIEDMPLEDTPIDATPIDDVPSLAEIAAAAEADALAVESSSALLPIAGLSAAGAGASLAALVAKPADTQDTIIQAAEATAPIAAEDIISQTKHIPTQETSMPVKAVHSDNIIDAVTETATSGAFAELNQIVEDKAVFTESGPRVGELVQDALRPMLKEWLDKNLKGIVERAVTKEVKRISKGG